MTDVTVTLRAIQREIAAAAARCGRDPSAIRLVAVSKKQPLESIRAAIAAGQADFGENYLQEAVVKTAALAGSGAVWHFIGRVQANKTREIATAFDWVQTVDRQRVAIRLNEHRAALPSALNVCIQVRLERDARRPGIDPEQVSELAGQIELLPRLRLRGLMCMPPLTGDPVRQRGFFDTAAALFDSLRRDGLALDTLSMGTTADLATAIAAGSTMVRIGTAVFGPRPLAGP